MVAHCRLTKQEKLKGLRTLLRKYGDVPDSEIKKAVNTKTLNQWILLCEGKTIVSAGRVEKTDWYLWTVKNLFTNDAYRGRGLGSSVVRLLIKKAIRGNAKVIAADITYDNIPSKKIFLRLGFKVISSFKWGKSEKPANILHFVLYPPKRGELKYAPSSYSF